MAPSIIQPPNRPYNRTIYFLDLVITLSDHDPLSRKLELHLPSTYTPAEARAILDHSAHQLRTHPSRTFTPLPIIHHHNNSTKPTSYTLHVDLSADVLCLNNIQDDTTLPFLPRNATLTDLLPVLNPARRIAFPWTPDTFTVHCPRCDARAWSPDTAVCPSGSTNRSLHWWEQVIPSDLLSLWPGGTFPQLEKIYVVVDTGKFPSVMKLRDEKGVAGCRGEVEVWGGEERGVL